MPVHRDRRSLGCESMGSSSQSLELALEVCLSDSDLLRGDRSGTAYSFKMFSDYARRRDALLSPSTWRQASIDRARGGEWRRDYTSRECDESDSEGAEQHLSDQVKNPSL